MYPASCENCSVFKKGEGGPERRGAWCLTVKKQKGDRLCRKFFDIDIDIGISRRMTANTPQRPYAFPSAGYERRLDSSGRACRPRVGGAAFGRSFDWHAIYPSRAFASRRLRRFSARRSLPVRPARCCGSPPCPWLLIPSSAAPRPTPTAPSVEPAAPAPTAASRTPRRRQSVRRPLGSL